jgi:hypothetical protein
MIEHNVINVVRDIPFQGYRWEQFDIKFKDERNKLMKAMNDLDFIAAFSDLDDAKKMCFDHNDHNI